MRLGPLMTSAKGACGQTLNNKKRDRPAPRRENRAASVKNRPSRKRLRLGRRYKAARGEKVTPLAPSSNQFENLGVCGQASH